jgi:hypothetical protein
MGIEYCRAIAPATAGRLSAVRATCPRSMVHVLGPWDRTRSVMPIIVSDIRCCVKHPFINAPVTFADSATQRLQGIVCGGQIGYDYQINPRSI